MIHLGHCGICRELKTKSEIEAGAAVEMPKLGKEFREYRFHSPIQL